MIRVGMGQQNHPHALRCNSVRLKPLRYRFPRLQLYRIQQTVYPQCHPAPENLPGVTGII